MCSSIESYRYINSNDCIDKKAICFCLLIMYWLNVFLFFALNTFCADVYLLKTDSRFASFEDFKTCRLNKNAAVVISFS